MRRQKPSWWLLYAIVLLMFIALLGITWIGIRGVPGEIVTGAIVLGAFGLMFLWVKANQAPLWSEEYRREEEQAAALRRARTTENRSLTENRPRTTQHEAPPRTGFGSGRSKWYRVRVQESVGRDIVRISHLQIEE